MKKNITIMKFLGILLIILAHVGPMGIIHDLRVFDVPMMVFISGYLSCLGKQNNSSYIKYIYRRFKRLIVPSYVFLVFFFLFFRLLDHPFSFIEMRNSFLFFDNIFQISIACIWIIKIYFLISIVNPILIFLYRRLDRRMLYFSLLFVYVLYEVMYAKGIFIDNLLFNQVIYYLIPYSCISFLGIVVYHLENDSKKMHKLLLTFLLLFVVFSIIIYMNQGIIFNPQLYKYPPRIYFISYSLFVTILLFLIFKNRSIVDFVYNKFVEFVGRSSLWIYLHHMTLVYLLGIYNLKLGWYVDYLVVFFISIFITYLQNKIVDFLISKYHLTFLNVFKG